MTKVSSLAASSVARGRALLLQQTWRAVDKKRIRTGMEQSDKPPEQKTGHPDRDPGLHAKGLQLAKPSWGPS